MEISKLQESSSDLITALHNAWTPVQELLKEAGWSKTAKRVNDLPGMKMKVASYKDIAMHLILLAAVSNLMGCEVLLAPAEA